MTNLEQQDIEAFKSWANGTNPAVNPSYYQTWQAALAYERGKRLSSEVCKAVGLLHDWYCEESEKFVLAHPWDDLDEEDTHYAKQEAVMILARHLLPSPPATQPQESNNATARSKD